MSSLKIKKREGLTSFLLTWCTPPPLVKSKRSCDFRYFIFYKFYNEVIIPLKNIFRWRIRFFIIKEYKYIMKACLSLYASLNWFEILSIKKSGLWLSLTSFCVHIKVDKWTSSEVPQPPITPPIIYKIGYIIIL